MLENGGSESKDGEEEDFEAKRRRVLAETRDVDADSSGSDESSDEDRYAWLLAITASANAK
jgi:protein CWC15